MPSGPPELHQYWCDKDPIGSGDTAAWEYLKSRGYRDRKFVIYHPDPNHKESEEDAKAINYLCWEWDWAFDQGIANEQSTTHNRDTTG